MLIKHDTSLREYNTFGIDVIASAIYECDTTEDIRQALMDTKGTDRYILGGGSNVLFLKDYSGAIIIPKMKGIEILREEKDYVIISAGAGETWDDMVSWSISHGLYGAENLSGIPGNVGASPVQNIGAYGAEAKDIIESVTYIDADTLEERSLSAAECHFGYRDSIFKHELRGKAVITQVLYRMTRTPNFKLDYGALRSALGDVEPTAQAIRAAVIATRDSKLPNPKVTGNAGSFFKNPEISKEKAEDIRASYPDVPLYPTASGLLKIAAGWMIDKCGWKGRSLGRAAVHDRQALVLINKGGATGQEIVDLCEAVRESVYKTFGIEISPEVNFVK